MTQHRRTGLVPRSSILEDEATNRNMETLEPTRLHGQTVVGATVVVGTFSSARLGFFTVVRILCVSVVRNLKFAQKSMILAALGRLSYRPASYAPL